MTHTVALASRDRRTRARDTIGVLSNFSSISLLFHMGWPQLQQVHDGVSCTTHHNIRGYRKRQTPFSSRLQHRPLVSGRTASMIWKQLTPSGRRAKSGQQQALRKGPLLTTPHLSHLAPPLFALFWTSRSADTSREVHWAATRATSGLTNSSHGRSNLASRCTFSRLPRQLFLRVRQDLPEDEETGWRSSQLDSPRVVRTRQAEETGRRSSHLDSPRTMGRAVGTGGIRRRMQRSSSARCATQTPLATVPRGDSNQVGACCSDGGSDSRSGLRLSPFFPRLLCFSLVSF